MNRPNLQRKATLINISPQRLEEVDEKSLELESKNLEQAYNKIKNKMRIMKNEQLERIGKEFLLNSYEKRFKVS